MKKLELAAFLGPVTEYGLSYILTLDTSSRLTATWQQLLGIKVLANGLSLYCFC